MVSTEDILEEKLIALGMLSRESKKQIPPMTFADVFAGCGGLSLGLINAGWNGRFAIEKHPAAFGTLKTNLIDGKRKGFDWLGWLPENAISTSDLLHKYSTHLDGMKGEIDLLAGGPPCQGFSLAGRRTHSDPRNSLMEDYIRIVQKLEPRFLLIENVRGFTLPFKKHGDGENKDVPYSERIQMRLEQAGYTVYSQMGDLSHFGVPQTRRRFILIAIRNGDPAHKKLNGRTPFVFLEKYREAFLSYKRLPCDRPVSAREAIGDLEVDGKELIDSEDSPIKGFKQIVNADGNYTSPFITLMRTGVDTGPNSLRLPRHGAQTINQFRKIITTCTKGKTLGSTDRKRLGLKKRAITPLDGNMPSATITTLPDDIIHYSEPRILTVRENARIQTFPDWFQFTGMYTTGTKRRQNDCPRYTQVGNAVPPLFSEAIGLILKRLASKEDSRP